MGLLREYTVRISSSIAAPACLLLLLSTIIFPILFCGVTTNAITTSGVLDEGAYGYHGVRPSDSYTRDPLGSMAGDLANEVYTRNSLKSGVLPYWNPYQGLGYPYMSDPSSNVFYPINLLRLVVPIAYWDLIGLLHLFLLGYFVYLFSTACGLSRYAALFSGACTFSMGHFLVYLTASSIIQTEAWLPLLLFAIESAIQGSRRRLTWSLGVIATYGIATGGHPGAAIFGLITVAIYLLVRLLQRPDKWRGVIDVAIPILGGGMLAAPTWLNFLDFIKTDTAVAKEAYSLVYNVHDLAALFFPYLYGAINTSMSHSANAWGIGFIPPVVSFFAVAAFWRDRAKSKFEQLAPMLVASVVLIGWGLQLPGFSLLRNIPFFGRLNANYLWAIPALCICMAAGVGFATLLSPDRRTWRRALVAWALIVTIFIALFYAATRTPYQIDFSGLSRSVIARGLYAGLAWSCVVPLMLYAASNLVLPANRCVTIGLIAYSGVIFSALAYFPSGEVTSGILAGYLGLISFAAISVAAIGYGRRAQSDAIKPMLLAAPILSAGLIGVIVAIAVPGLPLRHDPIQMPPYVKWLQEHVDRGRPRIFGVGGTLTANFASDFDIFSINLLTAMSPAWNAKFIKTYLDGDQTFGSIGGNFLGITAADMASYQLPWEHLYSKRAFWNLVGIRYLVGRSLNADYVRIPVAYKSIEELPSSEGAAALAPNIRLLGDGKSIEAKTDCSSGEFDRVGVTFSTWGRINNGVVEIVALAPDGSVLGRARGDAAKLGDNAPYVFNFGHLLCAKKSSTPIVLRLSFQATDQVSELVVWQQPGRSGFNVKKFRLAPASSEPNLRFSPLALNRTVEFDVPCPAVPTLRTAIVIGNYLRVNPGELIVTYTNSAGQVSTSADETKDIGNMELFATTETKNICSGPEDVLNISISFKPSAPGSMIAAFKDFAQDRLLAFLATKAPNALTKVYQDLETGVMIWKNDQAQAPMYLAGAWKSVPDWQSSQEAFAQQSDLRRVAFVEGDAAAACPSDSSVEPEDRIFNFESTLNSVSATVDTAKGGVLTLTDLWMPGWVAHVNGASQKIFRVNGIFRGVCLPAPGRYNVVFSYEPPLFWLSVAVAGGGITLLMASGCWLAWRHRQV